MHEFAHALGIKHTQQRRDRDGYISINWNNIRFGTENNFEIDTYSPTCGCYNCSSMMHYHEYAFTSNGQKTIESNNETTCNIQRNENNPLSSMDIVCIKGMYFDGNIQCANGVPTPSPTPMDITGLDNGNIFRMVVYIVVGFVIISACCGLLFYCIAGCVSGFSKQQKQVNQIKPPSDQSRMQQVSPKNIYPKHVNIIPGKNQNPNNVYEPGSMYAPTAPPAHNLK